MTEKVDNQIRDEVMANILAKPENQVCFDCGSKAPKWSSPYLGIVICYECAAKHRSYGTSISFVRSVDLDKWNRKQLKSLELTGNAYTKQRFNDLGVPLIGGNYDYNNSLVLKVRQEIEEKVKEALKPNEYKKVDNKKKEDDKKEEEFENININKEEKKEEKKVKEEKKEKEKEKEKEEIKKPQKFEINQSANVKNAKVISKASKINKIKKMDFNFDFDSFNDVNFSDFTEKEQDNNKENKINEEIDDDEQKEKETEKEKEMEQEKYHKSYSNSKVSEEEFDKKFSKKKAISSEDYENLERGNSDNKVVNDRIKSMGNSQAISSEDIFGSNGESNDYYEGESMTDKLKDLALNFTLSAAEKAKQLKNKTNEFINKVQNKLSGGGY